MATKREGILDAVTGCLTSITGVLDASVYRSRVTALARGEFPAIIVEPLNDLADRPTIARTQWSLTFQVLVLTRSDDPSASDLVINDVHSKIMNDATLNSLLVDLAPVSVDWQYQDGDKPLGVASMQFRASYQTSTLDISN